MADVFSAHHALQQQQAIEHSMEDDVPDEVPVTYQSFFPGQLVISREFPEGSLRDYRRCTCMVMNIAGSPNLEITMYKITKEFIDDGHSFPISSQPGLVLQTITGPLLAATVNFPLLHDPSFIRTCCAYTCDPSIPIRDGRRSVEGLGNVLNLEDLNRIREFIVRTEFRPLTYPLMTGPQIRHPPLETRPSMRRNNNSYESRRGGRSQHGPKRMSWANAFAMVYQQQQQKDHHRDHPRDHHSHRDHRGPKDFSDDMRDITERMKNDAKIRDDDSVTMPEPSSGDAAAAPISPKKNDTSNLALPPQTPAHNSTHAPPSTPLPSMGSNNNNNKIVPSSLTPPKTEDPQD